MSYETSIELNDDGESGRIDGLDFRSRTLHRQLADLDEGQRELVVRDALDIGAEVLARAGRHGDLEQLTSAVERLDDESRRIVAGAATQVEKHLGKVVAELSKSMQGEDGPLAIVLSKFDPAAKDNVIDIFRSLVSDTAAKATKAAVKDLAEATQETVERLNGSVAALDRFAAIEEARQAEAQRGTARGLDHEVTVETLLGELTSVVGDGLDDVSRDYGASGTKKGDKVITPRGGLSIVTEDKSTSKKTENAIRVLLNDSMANRGAALGIYIVDDESKVPGNQPFHLIDDDKVVVVADRLTLRLVYTYFRAKAIALATVAYSSDDEQLSQTVETILEHVDDIKRTLDRFKQVRTEHTKAATAIQQAKGYVNDMADSLATGVDGIVLAINALVTDDEQSQKAA